MDLYVEQKQIACKYMYMAQDTSRVAQGLHTSTLLPLDEPSTPQHLNSTDHFHLAPLYKPLVVHTSEPKGGTYLLPGTQLSENTHPKDHVQVLQNPAVRAVTTRLNSLASCRSCIRSLFLQATVSTDIYRSHLSLMLNHRLICSTIGSYAQPYAHMLLCTRLIISFSLTSILLSPQVKQNKPILATTYLILAQLNTHP